MDKKDCIFCKIIRGEIPSTKIYEDDNNLAFLDIYPISYGHTLIIPKKHYQNLEDIDIEELNLLIQVVKKVGSILKEKLNISGYNLIENNDKIAGQVVPHIHFHIIPRKNNDNLKHWKHSSYKDGEIDEIIQKINS